MIICPVVDGLFYEPMYATDGSGAFDLCAQHPFTMSKEPVMVDLGFKSAIPVNHVGLVLPRSGMGFKYGVELMNTAGVIDSDYRGEWKAKVVLKECGEHDSLLVKAGDRFLQCLIVPVKRVNFTKVNEFDFAAYDTARGEGGFGHSGV